MAKQKPPATIQNIEEQEANLFAMYLLMPDHFVEAYLKEHPMPDVLDTTAWWAWVTAMAQTFEVPEGLVVARLGADGIFGRL